LAMHTLGRAHPHPSAGAGVEPRHLVLISLRKSSNGDFVKRSLGRLEQKRVQAYASGT
jgi:hypothetical protein